ncbi:MAG: aminotransferase class V-fold PLP-dependent enzyme [Actinobacteria bacterium]|nr:aminotransferase class V-fold PLP-dependent enzyme [Actinomycetota bacterium]
MHPAQLRAQFPVFERLAFLNAGTCGPVPRGAVRAASELLDVAASEGRAHGYFTRMLDLRAALRESYAALLNAQADDVAITTCTSEGVVRVLAGLELHEGDEILTSIGEHPGLLGPLAAVRAQRGVTVREVALEQIADAVTDATRLVACSHVSWIDGRIVPDLSGLDVPVLLDGAQGVGAVPVDVAAIGCTFYAGSGQKWLCGPVGTGMLWVAPQYSERLLAPGPTYRNLADPGAGLDAVPRAGAARHDAAALSAEATALAAASLGVLGQFGWQAVHERAATLAQALADALGGRGIEVAARERTTLVSWQDPDPAATRARLAGAGVIIRDLPGTGLLRASVGAWNDESDLERLLSAI